MHFSLSFPTVCVSGFVISGFIRFPVCNISGFVFFRLHHISRFAHFRIRTGTLKLTYICAGAMPRGKKGRQKRSAKKGRLKRSAKKVGKKGQQKVEMLKKTTVLWPYSIWVFTLWNQPIPTDKSKFCLLLDKHEQYCTEVVKEFL